PLKWKNKNQRVIFGSHLKVHQKTHLLRKIIDFGQRGCENEKDDGGMRCKKSERERETGTEISLLFTIVMISWCLCLSHLIDILHSLSLLLLTQFHLSPFIIHPHLTLKQVITEY